MADESMTAEIYEKFSKLNIRYQSMTPGTFYRSVRYGHMDLFLERVPPRDINPAGDLLIMAHYLMSGTGALVGNPELLISVDNNSRQMKPLKMYLDVPDTSSEVANLSINTPLHLTSFLANWLDDLIVAGHGRVWSG